MKKAIATSLVMALSFGTVTAATTMDGTTASAKTSSIKNASGTYITTTAKSLYATAKGKKIGTIKRNAKVTLLKKRTVNGKWWYQISGSGKKGWVAIGNWKKLRLSSVKTYKHTYKTKTRKSYYASAGSFNARSGIIPRGKQVKTTQYRTVNGVAWVRVSGYGWTLKSNLKTVTKKTSSSVSSTISYGERFLGVPYVWGGTTPSGFDCSGFTSYVYKHALGKSIPRTSTAQYASSKKISKSSLQVGDLVFFNTSGGGVSHVSIYAGNNKLLHAAGNKVKYSNINDGYWNKRIVGYGTFR
ncbi:C40 family peptidase [Kurthia senegalensis]|uniref:C40 family peptidase n=1 Tax=Kurthia senegalensis TaxID=1033740 RepID=UPI0002894C85|nr:SH3 domain-containing C40 family peptidase [Kurthia senegalensis]